jgi:hypothetical protein
VGTDTWFGVFAYSGFLFAHGLGRRWRIPAFACTALVVTAAMVGGYPTGLGDGLLDLPAGRGRPADARAHLGEHHLPGAGAERRPRPDDRRAAEANRRLEESMAENAALHARLVEQARAAGWSRSGAGWPARSTTRLPRG